MTPSTYQRLSARSASRAGGRAGDRPFIHPLALCDSKSVGSDTRIWAFAHVMEGAVLGADCNVGGHCFIESGAVIGDRVTIKNGTLVWNGVTIEDDAFIGPGVVFTNDKHPRSPRSEVAGERYAAESWISPTRVQRGATIGASAVIVCGIGIGAYSMIGAGAVVTRNVPAQRLVMGNPARIAGWVCRCGARLHDASACSKCDRKYRLVGEVLVLSE